MSLTNPSTFPRRSAHRVCMYGGLTVPEIERCMVNAPSFTATRPRSVSPLSITSFMQPMSCRYFRRAASFVTTENRRLLLPAAACLAADVPAREATFLPVGTLVSLMMLLSFEPCLPAGEAAVMGIGSSKLSDDAASFHHRNRKRGCTVAGVAASLTAWQCHVSQPTSTYT